MNKLNGIVYIDTEAKKDLLQKLKDNEEVLPVNLFLKRDGSILFFELIEEEDKDE